MPGQSALTPDERRVFLRGQMVDTADGPIFLHGDVMVNNKNQVQFLPGQLVYNEERDKEEFIPGITGETATGTVISVIMPPPLDVKGGIITEKVFPVFSESFL